MRAFLLRTLYLWRQDPKEGLQVTTSELVSTVLFWWIIDYSYKFKSWRSHWEGLPVQFVKCFPDINESTNGKRWEKGGIVLLLKTVTRWNPINPIKTNKCFRLERKTLFLIQQTCLKGRGSEIHWLKLLFCFKRI